MSEPHEFGADEIRAAARRIRALPDDTDRVPDRLDDAAQRTVETNPGFASASELTVIAEEHRRSVTDIGERLTDQAGRILDAVEARESGDEAAAAEFDRIDPPS